MAWPPPPLPDSYWVEPGRLLAGAYPGAVDTAVAGRRMGLLRNSGVTLVVDLTEPAELLPAYGQQLGEARHERRPIPDLGVVAHDRYAEILDLVDEELASGGCVYVHCLGGLGRTGTVVGCWLMRHGRDGGDPIGGIARLRSHLVDAHLRSPQTAAQEAIVRGWRRGD
ncbi:MAG: serine/threonine protein phosphatase [Thermoleophilia bacterium]|nr:serine/threonine protein phosphatase [Thermoleophilia bacterium]MDH4345985.1 serine/threonine protein phosphatase [Thermoleophilia bacterium]MDH5332326.1 serine/threonine protein phosphatase [Thermoleophilia bacterium]